MTMVASSDILAVVLKTKGKSRKAVYQQQTQFSARERSQMVGRGDDAWW